MDLRDSDSKKYWTYNRKQIIGYVSNQMLMDKYYIFEKAVLQKLRLY